MTMSTRDELFRRYLGCLGWVGDPGLHELVNSHLIKVPFENVSALLRPDAMPIDDFVAGVADWDLGGTNFTIASHFTELLRYLDYEVELLAAEVGGVARSHAVCRVRFEDQLYLVDVGYGAPFHAPISLTEGLPLTLPHGDLAYVVDRHPSHPEAIEVTTLRGGVKSHSYIARPPAVAAESFAPSIQRALAPQAPLLRMLRISRFFASRAVEIYNNRLVVTHHNITTTTPIRDLDELETLVHELMQLPRMPVREAVLALRERGVDVFAG